MAVKGTFQPDQGYSWVVLFAAFMLNVQYSAGVGSIGVFLVEFIDYFQVSKAATTLLAGLLLCTGFVLGFPVGWLCRYYSFRAVAIAGAILSPVSLLASAFAHNISMLYFTYGCLTSLALTTLHNTGSIGVQKYFDRKRAMASGVAVCGVSIGVFFWAPFSRWTIDLYGWRGALVIQAGVQLHSLVFALLLRPPRSSTQGKVTDKLDPLEAVPLEQTEENAKDLEDEWRREGGPPPPPELEQTSIREGGRCGKAFSRSSSIFQLPFDYPSLGPYLIGVVLIQAGHITPYSFVPVRAQALHIDKRLAATLVSMIGIASLCARALFGFVGDVRCVNRAVLCGLSGVAAGVCTTLSALLTNYTLLAIYSSILGVVSAPYIALQAAAVVDMVGVENAAPGIGYLSTSLGTAHIIALSLSGYILDQLKDPKYAFLVFGGGEILGGFIIVLTSSINIWKKRKRQHTLS